MVNWTHFSDVSWLSWQSTQAERCSRILKSLSALGSLLGWRQWLRPQNAGCTVPLHCSTAGDQAHTRSRTHRMSGFWFPLLKLVRKEEISGKRSIPDSTGVADWELDGQSENFSIHTYIYCIYNIYGDMGMKSFCQKKLPLMQYCVLTLHRLF